MYQGIILASASPRRKTLLNQMGVEFSIIPSGVDETEPLDELPGPYCARLAIEKAAAVGFQYPEYLVIGADTVVALGDRIMGKPNNTDEAFDMLTTLSGQWHEVWTGVCLFQQQNEIQRVKAVQSHVKFKDLNKDDIDSYINTGEPMDKAGAYAIQGIGAKLVKEVKGSYHNVIGLPTHDLGAMFDELGVNFVSNIEENTLQGASFNRS